MRLVVTWGKNAYVQHLVNEANGDEPLLAIVFPCILSNKGRVPFETIHELKRKTPFSNVAQVLFRIEAYFRGYYCTHNNRVNASKSCRAVWSCIIG